MGYLVFSSSGGKRMSREREMQGACCRWPKCEIGKWETWQVVLIGSLAFAFGVLAMGLAYDYRALRSRPVVVVPEAPDTGIVRSLDPRLVQT